MTEPLAVRLPGGSLVDHLVLGVPDTMAAADELAGTVGVRPTVSDIEGEHYPTRSGSIGLAGESFLELYGPNPTYAGPANFFHDLLVDLPEPRLLTFMVRVRDLGEAIDVLGLAGHRVEPMLDEWERTHAPSFRNAQFPDHALDPAVPRLIEWNDRLGMDERFVQGATLHQLKVSTPNHDVVADIHRILGIDGDDQLALVDGQAGLAAELDTPSGRIAIR